MNKYLCIKDFFIIGVCVTYRNKFYNIIESGTNEKQFVNYIGNTEQNLICYITEYELKNYFININEYRNLRLNKILNE